MQKDVLRKKPSFKISQTTAPRMRLENRRMKQNLDDGAVKEEAVDTLGTLANQWRGINGQKLTLVNQTYKPVVSIEARRNAGHRLPPMLDFMPYANMEAPKTLKMKEFFKPTAQTIEETESLREEQRLQIGSTSNYSKAASISQIPPRNATRFRSVEPSKTFQSMRTTLSNQQDRDLSIGNSKLTKLEIFYADLNLSNGIVVDRSAMAKSTCYRYFLNKYNNASLVRRCFLRRPWWKELPEDQIKRCHMVWTQYPIQKLYSRKKFFLPKGEELSEKEPQFNQNGGESLNLFAIQSKKDTIEGKNPNRIDPNVCLMTNKMSQNVQYGHKSAMYLNLKHYCKITGTPLADLVPLSFYVDSLQASDYEQFKEAFKNQEKVDQSSKNLWLVKPAEFTFGGNGIIICDSISKVEQFLKEKFLEQSSVTSQRFIIQKYLEKPLLYKGRKFDIRAFCLLTCYNRRVKAYWHDEGYIRTTSQSYSLADISNLDVHLTNDCHQKSSKLYGAFEGANKLLYNEFFPSMEATLGERKESLDAKVTSTPGETLRRQIVEQMKSITVHLVRATAKKFEPKRDILSFELMGLDFMIDSSLKVFLIEANNSPSLSKTENFAFNTLLESIIEDVFQTAIDPIFQPPDLTETNSLPPNPKLSSRFRLIYDELEDKNLQLGDPSTYGYQMAT
jgi:hypothetical protein